MSASNVNKAAGPRQVTCATSGNHQIPVDLDLLRLSGTFKDMCDDLGLEEHDEFPGVFPVKNVNFRTFKKVIDWCKEHKDEPEPVIEKDPLTQECKWFEFTESERLFFDVPMSQLLGLVKAANYLEIPRLYHYACQAIAAGIKGKHPGDVCCLLQQDCDIGRAQIKQIRKDNPWLPSVLLGARTKNAVFIPNEVLVTIFEKLPREELERFRLVSTQFDAVIRSDHQGPLRVVSDVEFEAHSYGSPFPHGIDVRLRDGTMITCPDLEDLAKRLKFSTVQNLRLGGYAGIHDLSSLLPVKSAWKNATVEASMPFSSSALFEFAFTQLFLCKEVILNGAGYSANWPRALHLTAIAECNKLDIYGQIQPDEVVEWLEHDAPPEKKWSEPRQMILNRYYYNDNTLHTLITALKTAFLASTRPKPYVVRIRRLYHDTAMNEVLANEKTHETLSIRAEQYMDVLVKRA